jgi:hypothetical protein
MAEQIPLKNLLLSCPREVVGSRTQSKFDYQKNWLICKLLELYSSNLPDFAIVSEQHEDAIVLDSEKSPESMEFFQIKTKDRGSWKKGDLLKKSKINSILGKLYLNRVKFKNYALSLNFVSNADTDLPTNPGKNINSQRFSLNQIKDKIKLEICNKIKEELKLSEEISSEILFFEKSNLQGIDHDSHARGKIDIFFEKKFPTKTINTGIIHRALFEEARRKTNLIFKQEGTFEEFISKKAFTKSFFDEFLLNEVSSMIKDNSSEMFEDVCKHIFNDDSLSMIEKNLLKEEIKKYRIEILDQNKLTLKKLTKKILKILQNSSNKFNKVSELTSSIYDKYLSIKEQGEELFSEDYIKGIIIWEYFKKNAH